MADALLWWAAVQGLALAALPLTVLAFRPLPDRGYALAKILGPLLFTVLLWGIGLTHTIPVSRGVVWGVFYLFLFGNLLLLRRARGSLRALWRDNWRMIVTTEALFGGVFALWAVVRAFTPEIDGTEKPMDFAMLNAAWRSMAYPPEDPWLAGFPVAYYYLGYLTAATIAKLSGIPTAVGFNLAVATLAAQAAAGAFSVAVNLAAAATPERSGRRRGLRAPHLLAGLLAAFLLIGVGNLEGVLELARARGLGTPEFFAWVGVKDLQATAPSARWYPDDFWFWWRSTRVVDTLADGKSLDYTISEYPVFSFLLGDLHPHVMALPLTLLALGTAAALVLGGTRPRRGRSAALMVLGPAFVLGALGFTNIWDLPTYTVIVLAAGALRTALERAAPRTTPVGPSEAALPVAVPSKTGNGWSVAGPSWLAYGVWAAAVVVATVALFLPFYVGTLAASISGVSGGEPGGLLRWWTGPASRPLHTLLFWGPLLAGAGLFAWALAGRLTPAARLWARAGIFFPVVLWLTLEAQTYRLSPSPEALSVVWTPRVWPVLPLAVGALLLWRSVRAARRSEPAAAAREQRAVALALLLAGAGVALIAVCEWVYLRDIFASRMNTVFKLYYQAWTLLAVSTAAGLYYVLARGLLAGPGGRATLAAFGVLLLACAGVTPAALANRTGGFAGTPTLDGLAHIARTSSGEAAAVDWLLTQPPPAAILEAPGPQYSRFAQLSARTGVPTLLGWPGHEVQWRGSLPALGERERDADTVYQATDKQQVLPLLRRYQVEYVVVGPAERSRYAPGVLQAFEGAYPVAFRHGDVTIYRVPRDGDQPAP